MLSYYIFKPHLALSLEPHLVIFLSPILLYFKAGSRLLSTSRQRRTEPEALVNHQCLRSTRHLKIYRKLFIDKLIIDKGNGLTTFLKLSFLVLYKFLKTKLVNLFKLNKLSPKEKRGAAIVYTVGARKPNSENQTPSKFRTF